MKILVTGGTGLVGSAFENIKTGHEIIRLGSNDCDLLKEKEAKNMIEDINPDAIIHLAAKVGGVKGNTNYISDFFYDNNLININVLNAAKDQKIKKVLSLLSTCIYPDKSIYPLTEDQIHNGEPHKSNFGYAYAKRMLEVHSRAIRQQYKLNYITAVPNNIYGPKDNFDLENGHVIPAIIRKIWEAKINNKPPVFWGSGRALREFTYSSDIANALILLLENYDNKDPVNIGQTNEISIWTVVRKICDILEYDGEVIWDKSKPEGQYRKPSNNDKFLKIYPSFKYTSFNDGLRKTCNWFTENYPNIRGVN